MHVFDEMVDLVCGYVILHTGDYHLDPGHTPVPRCLVAVPALLKGAALPEDWKTLDHWNLALDFEKRNANVYHLLFWGRVMMLGVCLATGVLVFLWTRGRCGTRPALVAATIFFLYPTTLGLAGFIGNDMPLALGVTLFAFSLDQLVTRWSWARTVGCGAALGSALLAKHTAAGLLPVLGLSLLWWAWQGGARARGARAVMSAALVVLTAAVMILLAYRVTEARYYLAGWQVVTGLQQGNVMNYFHGEYSRMGWWYYDAIAFLIKTPIPLLAVCLFYLREFSRHPTARWRADYPLVICLGVYFILLSTSPVHIGYRYIYPIFPVLCVLLAGVVEAGLAVVRRRTILAVLAAWYVWPVIQVFPYYSAYFNEFVGGPKNGYQWLHEMEWPLDFDALERYAASAHPSQFLWAGFDMGVGRPTYQSLAIGGAGTPENRDGPVLLAVTVTYLKSIMASRKDWFFWLEKYPPVTRIAYNTFVYDITNNREARQRIAGNL